MQIKHKRNFWGYLYLDYDIIFIYTTCGRIILELFILRFKIKTRRAKFLKEI